MAEAKKWIYHIETIGLLTSLFSLTRKKIIKEVCLKLGEEGWELAAMSYNCFNGRYILVFKKLEE